MVTQEIKLRIHEESDMFTPYDPDQKLLSEDVSDYLIRCYENMHRKSREEFSVHVFSDEPVSEERVKQALRDHCEQQRSNIKHELKLETYREICLGVLGLILLSFWFFLSQSREGIWMEVLSIMGWVAIWEATSIAIMRRPELHLLKKTYDHASKAQIVIDVAKEEE